MNTWQMQHAKARLTELVNLANLQGPQTINVRGKATAVVLSMKDFINISNQKPNVVEFFQSSPLKGLNLIIERNESKPRKTNL